MTEGFLQKAARQQAAAALKNQLQNIGPRKPPNLAKVSPLIANDVVSERVVVYVRARMDLSKHSRDARIEHLSSIDNQLYRQPEPEPSDQSNEAEKLRKERKALHSGHSVKPVQSNYGFANAQLQDAVTFITNLIAPDMTLFEAIADSGNQSKVNALATELNNEGIKAGHYAEIVKFVSCALKYNFSAMSVLWEKHEGHVLKPAAGGITNTTYDTTWEGNVIKAHDPYNFFCDVSVTPPDLPKSGEYFGWVEHMTGFAAKRAEQNGKMTWTARFVDENSCAAMTKNEYYSTPPMSEPPAKFAISDEFIPEIEGVSSVNSAPTLEVVHFVGWVDPILFKGVTLDNSVPGQLELWHFVMVNSKFLALAEKLPDTHGMLPCVCAMPNVDAVDRTLPSVADWLLPLGSAGNFILNYYVEAARKALGGITMFDPDRIPLLEMMKSDLTNAKIPVQTTATNPDVSTALKRYVDTPETGDMMQQIQLILDLMNKQAPTDFIKQMADLDRATEFQSAAVAMGGNRRNFMLARIIYTQAVNMLAVMLTQNVLAKKEQIEYIDEQTKQQVVTPVAQLASSDIEYCMGTGLRGIERLVLVNMYMQVVNYAVQSPQLNARIDLVRLFNYVTSLFGDHNNLAQFEMSDQMYAQMVARQAAMTAAQKPQQPQGAGTSAATGASPPAQGR
jgi:hypothetical protein